MTSPAPTAHSRKLRVADLLDRPGTSRRLALAFPPPDDFELDMAELNGLIRLDGVLESVVDGLLIRGTAAADLKMACARCLAALDVTAAAEVVELFVDPARPGAAGEVDAGYEIHEAQIELDTLMRDALLPAVPYRPLCDEACAGLCPTCGADLNVAACDCVDEVADHRWAALSTLRLPDNDEQ